MSSVTEHIYEGAVGIEIAVQVWDANLNQYVDLSGATEKKYRIRLPSGTVVEWDAEFDNGIGDDGWLLYTTGDDDLSEEGRYVGQARVVKSGQTLPTSWFDFWVHPSLPAAT